MNAKAVALIVVGIVLLSFVFTYFHVDYPTGTPEDLNLKVFQNQGFNGIGVGNNGGTGGPSFGNGKTSIYPQQQSNVVIKGYITNASSGKPLADSELFAFLYAAQTTTVSSSSGYYQITVLYTGKYTLAFDVYKYNTLYVTLSAFGNAVWNNMSFTPGQKYQIEGKTIGEHSTVAEPDVSLNLKGYFGSSDYIDTQSNSNGYFNVSAYVDSYYITVTSSQYSTVTIPPYLNVTGAQSSQNTPYLIQVLPHKYYNVSGYVFNSLKQPISDATVSAPTASGYAHSNNTGYYKIMVEYGNSYVAAAKSGFGAGVVKMFTTNNMTDVNITLININPFNTSQGSGGSSSSNTGTGTSGVPPSQGVNITKTLQGNSSNVNYSKGPSNTLYSLSGNITDSVTGQRVAQTDLKFFLQINGTIFYENVTTNDTGFYTVVFTYPGNYFLVVYSPFYDQYNFSIAITGHQYKNFDLTPYSDHVYTVTGFVLDSGGSTLSNMTVNANYVYVSSKNVEKNVSTKYNHTDAQGEYSLTIFGGNYTFSAYGGLYGIGYSPKKNVDRNLQDVNITVYIKPAFSGTTGTGTAGVGSAQAGNLTSFLGGSGNSSTINFNAPGNYSITGIVTNANNSLPVFDTPLQFFVNISGEFYYDNITTGNQGQYSLFINYQGTYKVAVYSKDYYLSTHDYVVSTNVANADFNMTPLPQYVHTVSGSVMNLVPNVVNTSTVYVGILGQNFLAKQNTTNTNGYFTIYLVNDSSPPDYSLHFVAPGYYNNTTAPFNLVAARIINERLTPLDSIGVGVDKLSSTSGTGIPFLSYSALIGGLSNSSDNTDTFATANVSSSPVSLDITLLNQSLAVQNTAYLGFVKIDGAIYRFQSITDGSGHSTLKLNLTGSMALLVSTVAYENSSRFFSVGTGPNSQTYDLAAATLYSDTLHLNSAYNYSWHVPDSLSVSNSLLPIVPTGVTNLTNGTDFSYLVQNGSYYFVFNNPNYVQNSFYGNVSGKDILYNETVVNYLLEINNKSVLTWTYNLSGPSTSLLNQKVTGTVSFVNLTVGTFTFGAYINGSLYESKSFTLSSSSPDENITFVVNADSSSVQSFGPSGETLYGNFNSSYNVSIYKIETNTTWKTNFSLSFNGNLEIGISVSANPSVNTTVSLSKFYRYTAGSILNVSLSGTGQFVYNQPSPIVIFYYSTSLQAGVVNFAR